jgi:hypothetical protein
MPRQRLRVRTSPLALVGRLLTFLFVLALIWYGAMTVLLALKVSPHTVNSISGYRTAYSYLAGLTPHDVNGSTTRAIVAGVGILAFLLFGYLAVKEILRPHFTRHDLELASDGRGEITVEPRAIERLAETARPHRQRHGAPRLRPRRNPPRHPAPRHPRPRVARAADPAGQRDACRL